MFKVLTSVVLFLASLNSYALETEPEVIKLKYVQSTTYIKVSSSGDSYYIFNLRDLSETDAGYASARQAVVSRLKTKNADKVNDVCRPRIVQEITHGESCGSEKSSLNSNLITLSCTITSTATCE